MSNILFVEPQKGEMYRKNSQDSSSRVVFNVSSYAPAPFNNLSPYTYAEEIKIPVPGRPQEISHSVEGIWQGLKLIDGSIDPRLFKHKPRKREGHIEGHQFGPRVLGIEEARREIFIPSYFYYLHTFPLAQEAVNAILDQQKEGKKIYVYDVKENGDLLDPRPLAHAAILAMYLNLKSFNQLSVPACEPEQRILAILDNCNITNEEKVELLRQEAIGDTAAQRALRMYCLEHPQSPDDFYLGKSLEDLI